MNKNPLPLFVAALGLFACGETTEQLPKTPLVDTVDASTEQCENGGTVIRTGLDDDDDGVLSDGEVVAEEAVCNGAPGQSGDDGADGQRSIIEQTEEPAGANCPNGGDRIVAGFDEDGDDQLDPEEIQSTAYVCDGADGAPAVRVLTETSSTTDDCPASGGSVVRVGLDDSADGVLDPGEVDVERTICGGEDGDAFLVFVDAEPAGANCPAGGQRVRSGFDANGDGLLEDTETDDEEFVCGPVPTITEITDVSAGSDDCPAGGQRIDLGVDANGDGVLEAGEVAQTTFICSGRDGRAVLTDREDIGAGAECPAGGERLAWGLDDDANGSLEPSEEDAVTFVCDGEDGADGTAGGAVRLEDEAPGANCVRGGTRIETGPDLDGDGQLADSEVRAIVFACNGQALSTIVDVSVEPAGANCVDGGRRVDVGTDDDASGALEPGEIDSTSYLCNTEADVPIRILTDTALADAVRGNPYNAVIEAIGGTSGGYQWTLTNPQAAPPGLALGALGTPSTTLSGSPTGTGTFTFEIEVEDFFGATAVKTFTITVEARPLEITSFVLPRLRESVSYPSTQLSAVGGDTATNPASWSVVAGSLPAGLSLSTAGVISGTPTTERGSFFVVEADDGTETVRAGLRIRGEQKYAAYCGDFVVDAQEDISVVSVVNGTITSTGTVIDNSTIEADCAEDIVISGQRDVIVFIGAETSGIEEIYAVDLANFPVVGAPVKLNPVLGSTSNDVSDFKISPTGEWVAFRADDRSNLDDELFVFDLTNLATASPVRVNSAQADVPAFDEYAWIPGTNRLVYMSDELAAGEESLFFYDADVGGTPTEINGPLVSLGDVLAFEVSQDGRWLVYVSDEVVNGQNRLYLVDVSGATPGAPLEFSGALASTADVGIGTGEFGVSPNGDWVHFVTSFDGSGGEELYVRSTIDQQLAPVRVSQDLSATSAQDVLEAVWAPDGRRIAYLGDVDTSSQDELYVADAVVQGPPIKVSLDPLSSDTDVDVNAIAGSDEFAWAPDATYVIYDIDLNTTASSQDEPHITFLDDPSNAIQIFSAGLSDDVLSVKVTNNGTAAFIAAELNGSSIVELFLVSIGPGAVNQPAAVNDPTPLGSSQDVDDDFALIDGGNGVFYWSDEITVDDDEALFRPITGGNVGPRTQVNPILPSGGDIDAVTVQEE